MGADYEGQETGIAAVKALPQEGKEYLAHHLNNSLGALNNMLHLGDTEGAKEIVWHMVEDLNRAGIRSGGGRVNEGDGPRKDAKE